MAGGNIELAGLRRRVAEARQFILEPADAWRLCGELRLIAGDGLRIRPHAQACVGQPFPGKQRAGIKLAQRGDVAMADDIARVNAVALADVFEQDNQRLGLRFAVGVPESAGRGVLEPGIDDFNADGAGIEPGAALPFALAGVPGALVFIDQLLDGRFIVVADQVMAADFAVGQ